MRKLSVCICGILLLLLISCKAKKNAPVNETVSNTDLKRGERVSCGPPGKEFGAVGFETSCPGSSKKDFDLGIALIHSFEYDEAEKVFAKIIDESPQCAMAYWGAAMANYHPLWAPPTPAELEKGANAITMARSLPKGSARDSAYVEAMAVFYENWKEADHKTRSRNFQLAMEKMHARFPGDKETAIFYALTLTAGADPMDKTYAQQKKAVSILSELYPNEPNHPGIIHYIIHSYDNPELASLALPEARKYASIAPSSAHAQHMPSHIFTRLGLWEENVKSNLAAAESAICYAENTGIKGHWDEEMHTRDYIVYAYLQMGDNKHAKEQWDYVNKITNVSPVNFKVAYAFAAIPSRYVLENKQWKEAASLPLYGANVEWKSYPWQKAIYHFARVLGAVNTNDLPAAKSELAIMQALHDTLVNQKDSYKATQVMIQLKTSQAWIAFKEGKNAEALTLMKTAADMEDRTEKHPVTPGEVIPARELLGDMLLQMNKPQEALTAYEAALKTHANRFNGLYGAAQAAEKANNPAKAASYYQQLIQVAGSAVPGRPELEKAKAFTKNKTNG